MFRSPSAGSVVKTSATQTRFIQERIQNVEKHFGEICFSLGSYARKIAGLRDKGDELSQAVAEYAASEKLNKNSAKALIEFADCLAFISDYRDTLVHRIEETVIHEVSAYGVVCKSAFEDVKACSIAREKELSHLKHVNKLRQQNPLGRMQISKAESDLQQAAAQTVRLGKSMEEHADKLEEKKLNDLSNWMKKLLMIEMSFHASALSVYSYALKQLDGFDTSTDLEEFRNSLRLFSPMVSTSSPARSQSVPSIALPKTPTEGVSKPKQRRSKSCSDYRLRAESLDSLKVEEYEELHSTLHNTDEDDEDSEEEDSEEIDDKLKHLMIQK